MRITLLFIDSFDSEYEGKQYHNFQFLDPKSLSMIGGTNLELKKELVPWQPYECTIDWRRNKLKVVSVSQ